MSNSSHRSYLGDSVYADFDGFNIILTTENGFGPSNTIAIEPEVLRNLNDYAERIRKQFAPAGSVSPSNTQCTGEAGPLENGGRS